MSNSIDICNNETNENKRKRLKTLPEICISHGCSKFVRSRGLCKYHYDEFVSDHKKKEPCVEKDCKNPQIRRGMCRKHYDIFRIDQRCHTDGCNGLIYRDSLCRTHLLETKGQCCYKGCESKEILCIKKMLCTTHYHLEYKSLKLKKEKKGCAYTGLGTSMSVLEYIDDKDDMQMFEPVNKSKE